MTPVNACNLFYTYVDLDKAQTFYRDTLGFQTVAETALIKVMQVAESSYITLVDASLGLNHPDETKCVTVAIVTPQVEAWYAYLQSQNVPMHRPYNPKLGDAHDGFVALDPEGYFIEIERFNPHPENDEKLIPVLADINTTVDPSGKRPPELEVQGTVVWLYYPELAAQQRFYEALFGVEMIVDQGWAKIYQLSSTGFVGLVDGAKGLHKVAETKGVTVSFWVDDPLIWREKGASLPDFAVESGQDDIMVGKDLGGYTLRWDKLSAMLDSSRLSI